MKKESSTNLQKYSGIAEQMIKMSLDCPEITNSHLYTDWEVMSSNGTSIAEKDEIDSTPTMQSGLELNKEK